MSDSQDDIFKKYFAVIQRMQDPVIWKRRMVNQGRIEVYLDGREKKDIRQRCDEGSGK